MKIYWDINLYDDEKKLSMVKLQMSWKPPIIKAQNWSKMLFKAEIMNLKHSWQTHSQMENKSNHDEVLLNFKHCFFRTLIHSKFSMFVSINLHFFHNVDWFRMHLEWCTPVWLAFERTHFECFFVNHSYGVNGWLSSSLVINSSEWRKKVRQSDTNVCNHFSCLTVVEIGF